MPTKPYPRFLAAQITKALKDTRVVMISGPRQAGKTTLVRSLLSTNWEYRTLDDQATYNAARSDPVGFIRGANRLAIDEIQRAPDLIPAIKRSVDEDQRPGRFIISGSANVMTIPTVSESLAGRVELVTLLPLSRSEVIRRRPSFIQSCFDGQPPRPSEKLIGSDLVRVILAGGYPEVLTRATPARQRKWCLDYVETIVKRDIRDISTIHKLGDMPRLVRVLTEYSGRLVNLTQVGGELGLHHTTIGTYLAILEQVYLLERVRPWFRNELKRLIKTPKLHFLDTGLLAALRGITLETVRHDRATAGPLFESYVFGELRKQATWTDQSLTFHQFLDKDQREVDFVIENGKRQTVGIEVKAGATVQDRDFSGMRALQQVAGNGFRCGIVLYDGESILPFGKQLFAVPFPSLWS